jgi:hypothetical protein
MQNKLFGSIQNAVQTEIEMTSNFKKLSDMRLMNFIFTFLWFSQGILKGEVSLYH